MTKKPDTPLDDFKERELEILVLMAEGLSNKEIGEQLFIATQTVRWYNKQIYSKLGTSRRTEAIALARSLGLIDGDESAETGAAARYQLPATHGPFIGRDAEMAELTGLIAQPEVRLLSIVAAGGMGKSRLSLELAAQLAVDYEHGAAMIDLTPVRRPDDIAMAALHTLGIEPAAKESPRQLLLDYCRNKHLLLLFDNMEHLLPGASVLTDLLAGAPNVKLIATSRERLNLRVETVYYLQPVTADASTLFVEIASMMRPTITLTEQDQHHIDQIVTLVGGMPLALMLAATWVDMLSPAEIVEEIQRSLDFLSVELGDMPERQRSIRAVIEPTWNRLNAAEKQAFMWASTFRGGFTREMFQAVTGASTRILQELLRRSLVTHGHKRRYAMHPLLRRYARDQLDAQAAFETAKRAHITAFITYVRNQNTAMLNGAYMQSLEYLDAEQDNYRAGLDWAIAGAAVEDGATLATQLSIFWDTRAMAYEGEYYLTQALDHALPDGLLAWCLCWRSRFNYRLGNISRAKEDAQAAVALAETLGDRALLARSLIYQSYLLSREDEYRLTERAYSISEEIQDLELMGMSLNGMGICIRSAGDSEKALAYYQQALDLCEQIGNLRGVAMIVYNIGLEYDNLRQPIRAREAYQRSLELKRQIGDRAGEARRLAVLASSYLLSEEFEQAHAHIQDSRAICEEVGDRFRWTYAVQMQGMLEYVMTQFKQAQATLQEGLPTAEELNNHRRTLEYYQMLGNVHLSLHQADEAHAYFINALKTAGAAREPYPYWASLTGYGTFLWTTAQSKFSVEIMAVGDRFRTYATDFDLRYLFNPQLYRIQQTIGMSTWEQIRRETATITLEQMFNRVMTQLQL